MQMTTDASTADTGLDSLLTVLHLQGVAADREQIRHALGTTTIGTAEILRCAKDFALKARACRSRHYNNRHGGAPPRRKGFRIEGAPLPLQLGTSCQNTPARDRALARRQLHGDRQGFRRESPGAVAGNATACTDVARRTLRALGRRADPDDAARRIE